MLYSQGMKGQGGHFVETEVLHHSCEGAAAAAGAGSRPAGMAMPSRLALFFSASSRLAAVMTSSF